MDQTKGDHQNLGAAVASQITCIPCPRERADPEIHSVGNQAESRKEPEKVEACGTPPFHDGQNDQRHDRADERPAPDLEQGMPIVCGVSPRERKRMQHNSLDCLSSQPAAST